MHLFCNIFRRNKRREQTKLTGRKRNLQFDAVKEGNPRMITTVSAVEAVVEDPFLPILKQDSNET